jgi:hypothetical protein
MNQPPEDSDIQITPVEFSPSQSKDAMGVVPPAPRQPYQFPLWVPVLIVLLTLIGATLRDMIALNRRMSEIQHDNAPVRDVLARSVKQSDFANALKDGIEKLSATDPVAAQIRREFFPPQAPPPKDDKAGTDSSTPPATTPAPTK